MAVNFEEVYYNIEQLNGPNPEKRNASFDWLEKFQKSARIFYIF